MKVTYTDHQVFSDLGSFFSPSKITLSVPGFDQSLGNLSSVEIKIDSQFLITMGAENTGSTPSNIALYAQANLEYFPLFLDGAINATGTKVASAFDGVFDFQGTSGFTINNALSDHQVFYPANMNAYINSPVSVTVFAKSLSIATGSGNMASFFRTKGESTMTVSYLYSGSNQAPSVAEPSIGLLGFCLIALFLLCRDVR